MLALVKASKSHWGTKEPLVAPEPQVATAPILIVYSCLYFHLRTTSPDDLLKFLFNFLKILSSHQICMLYMLLAKSLGYLLRFFWWIVRLHLDLMMLKCEQHDKEDCLKKSKTFMISYMNQMILVNFVFKSIVRKQQVEQNILKHWTVGLVHSEVQRSR